MRLHVCLLLFIITTDKTLALWHHRCGGNISLDQKPAGHINLTLPGIFNDTTRLNHTHQTPDRNLSLCTWLIDVPVGRKVLLKLVQLEGGSSISLRCVWTEEDHDLVLEKGMTALLSGCHRNKATLTLTGTRASSDTIQLSYSVQEDERNSSDGRTTRHPDPDLIPWSKTGTSLTWTAPISQEVVRRKERVMGRLYQGSEWSPRPLSVSGPSSQDQGLLQPTSPLQGLTVAGRADRETLPFPLPEEGQNNGADTSGAAHLTDSPISAREGTRLYFHTQHTGASNTETNFSHELTQTQVVLTDATASNSNTTLVTDAHKYTVTHTYKHADKQATTQAQPTVSGFSIPPLTSSPPELPPRTTWESGTILITNGEEKRSSRSQRSTDTLSSDLTSAVTSDPLKSTTECPQDDSSRANTDTEATASTTSSQGPSRNQSSTTYVTELRNAVSDVAAASFHPTISQTDSSKSTTSDVTGQTTAFESSDQFDGTKKHHTPTSSTQSHTKPPQSLTHSPHTSVAQTSNETQTATQSTQSNFINGTSSTVSTSSDFAIVDDHTSPFTSPSSTPRAELTLGDVVHNSVDTGTTAETYTLPPALNEKPSTNSQTPLPPLPTTRPIHPATPSYMLQTHMTFSSSSQTTHTPLLFTSSTTESPAHTPLINHKTMPVPFQTSTTKFTMSHRRHKETHLPLPTSANVSVKYKKPHNYITATHVSLRSLTTPAKPAKSDSEGNGQVVVVNEDESWQWAPSSTTTHTPTTGPPTLSWPTPHPSQDSHLALTPSVLTSASTWSSTTSQAPKFYIVPDQSVAIRVESIELLLQMIVEDSRSALAAGLEEDTATWVEPYLQKAPGFSRLLGVWSSGHAVQSLVEFKTSGALQWLSMTGPTSLLEQTGLAQAVREARTFRSSKITNITLGGVQSDVCDWLLQCPSGYKCVSQPGTTNYSCSSVCRFEYCHHHGICTHHPGQLPVCRCLVGDDFWYMGQRCDVKMTRARLVGACLTILLIMVTVIGILAFVAVRRYRAILIQAKVDQTRSSYRRFNHFDELSGRFWLRSWAGSADSLDNPAFTRSDELLHLRALDRPCCYHDDTLSLASTCPSHGPRINTIYPHSSQYAWRGSEMSMGDGVLDSGKASDLSVCSWPVEPIQWTPFPLLQQLASHRTPTVRVSRPRSYCEGMELVDLEKSWTA